MSSLSSTSGRMLRNSERSLNSHFVSPAQFCELLVSRRNLDRSDDPDAQARGLVDRSIGMRFLVKEEELAKFNLKSDLC